MNFICKATKGWKFYESINLKLALKSSLRLSNEEIDTLTSFVNLLKSAHFNFYWKGDVSQIGEYVKRFLFKLKNKGKVKKPLSYIKYGIDNQPNVESKDGNHIDAKEYHRDKRGLANVFDNYFMMSNPPSL